LAIEVAALISSKDNKLRKIIASEVFLKSIKSGELEERIDSSKHITYASRLGIKNYELFIKRINTTEAEEILQQTRLICSQDLDSKCRPINFFLDIGCEHLPELKEDTLLWTLFYKGKTLDEYIKCLCTEDEIIDTYKRALLFDGKCFNWSICQDEEDLWLKAHKDVEISLASPSQKERLHDTIDITIKYSNTFRLGYNRDGRPNNHLFTDDGIHMPLDFEARELSTISNSANKLLEENTVFPLNYQGFMLRNKLIPVIWEGAGFDVDSDSQVKGLCDYYATMPKKALSLSGSPKTTKVASSTLRGMYKSGEFAISMILEHMQGQYNTKEQEKLRCIRQVMHELHVNV